MKNTYLLGIVCHLFGGTEEQYTGSFTELDLLICFLYATCNLITTIERVMVLVYFLNRKCYITWSSWWMICTRLLSAYYLLHLFWPTRWINQDRIKYQSYCCDYLQLNIPLLHMYGFNESIMTYASISHVIGITRVTFLNLQGTLGPDKN